MWISHFPFCEAGLTSSPGSELAKVAAGKCIDLKPAQGTCFQPGLCLSIAQASMAESLTLRDRTVQDRTNTSSCPSSLFYFGDKILTKACLGRKGFIWLTGLSLSSRETRMAAQARKECNTPLWPPCQVLPPGSCFFISLNVIKIKPKMLNSTTAHPKEPQSCLKERIGNVG